MVFEPNRRYVELADAEHWAGHFRREGRDVWEHRERLLADAEIEPGSVVMDLGAGTGAFSRLLLERVGPTGQVHAIEVVDHFVDRLSELATRHPNLNVHRSPLTVRRGSVDRVVCIDTYHHLEQPLDVLRTVLAALRPGGRMLLVDLVRDEDSSAALRSHVRAGSEQVERELQEVGFAPTRRLDPLEENYVLECRRP